MQNIKKYLLDSQISVDSGQRVKKMKNLWKQSCFDRIQQPDIKDIHRISRPSVHRISWIVTPLFLLCTFFSFTPGTARK